MMIDPAIPSVRRAAPSKRGDSLLIERLLRAALAAALCLAFDGAPCAAAPVLSVTPARDAAIAKLSEALGDVQPSERLAAAESLQRLGFYSKIPADFWEKVTPGKQADDLVTAAQMYAIQSLSSPSREEAINHLRGLVDAIEAAPPTVRLAIVEAIQHSLPRLASPELHALADRLPNEPWQNRLAAASLRDAVASTESVKSLIALLGHLDANTRRGAARTLGRHTASLSQADLTAIEVAAASETDPETIVAISVIPFLAATDEATRSAHKPEIVALANSTNADGRSQFAQAMAERGGDDDVPLLEALLDDSAVGVRIAAANAIIRIDRRRSADVSPLDWLVLAAYGLGMIGVGWYYSRSSSVEDYLLGGREMKPWAVGISLFATLMSTLTYLAMPGEMIQHGPMILCGFLSYPLIYLIVSRLIIPYIMRLRVTSAYEILELRLGISVRLLGSAIFLILRLLWMGMIAYATSSVVLVPILGLDKSATPWICAIMALCTVAYTSAGGLKAVVATDVLQTFIMLVGAVLSLLLISRSLGGASEWWPREWTPHWDAPTLLFAKDSRVSAGLAFLSTLVWYICTSGSDQMAIQRYLATRDAKSASRMFGISLWCDAIVALLLAALGLALVAYSRSHPEILPDGQTLLSSADQLFPQFIVKVLPAGMSGLVVAGILSAAMDSLSSGLNSSSSVIMTDWVERFRPIKAEGAKAVQEAKLISWLVGIAVVLLSLVAGVAAGNLLEKCYTVVNLFTASLFVLFFMAMFVPWATTFGTWLGAVASMTVAITMAYSSWIDLSFLWITPASLLAGITVGSICSLLPIGVSQPMLTVAGDGISRPSSSI
jgi:solute:Na+ symporter, SSS family